MALEAGLNSGAHLRSNIDEKGNITFYFKGRLDVNTTGDLWRKVMSFLKGKSPTKITVQTEEVNYCDTSGIGLLFEIEFLGRQNGFTVEILDLNERFGKLLDMFDPAKFIELTDTEPDEMGITESTGETAVSLVRDCCEQLTFLGHLGVESIRVVLNPMQLRWKDAFLAAERAGADAVGIVLLLGFLFGLIMAFSSAMPLRQFGVEVYVADLVAIALVRVLGPFITAVILAGRSGSAFAAELGTMKINDEIDALITMGLEPVRFLVIPRVLATIIITPLLAILANLAGLIGSLVVMLMLGFQSVTYINHVKSTIDAGDIFAGLFKALVYGGIVGAIGCLRGLQTKTDASSVGISTTRAVVSGIILVVIAEGIFAVLYHYLEI